jgi:hypothetical protein
MTVNLGLNLSIEMMSWPLRYVPKKQDEKTPNYAGNILPGTAKSRFRAFNKRGETYWRSKVVSCGSCFSTFLKTCIASISPNDQHTRTRLNGVIDIPSLVKLASFAVGAVPSTSITGLTQFAPKDLRERRFTSSLRSLMAFNIPM